MYANTSVGSFSILLLGLMSWHGSTSYSLNCPNFSFGLVRMALMNISRLMFSKCFPQNVSYWMWHRFRYRGHHIVMPKEWHFGGWHRKCCEKNSGRKYYWLCQNIQNAEENPKQRAYMHGGMVIFVCFMLTNFRPPIVGRRAWSITHEWEHVGPILVCSIVYKW